MFVSLAIAWIFSFSHAYTKVIEQKYTDYSYNLLSLTWPGEYCSQASCNLEWFNDWDGSSFIIHGLWPSSLDKSALRRTNRKGYDPQCYQNTNFSQEVFNQSQLDQLNQYWPQIGNIEQFWAYEWKKHGTCYLYYTKNIYQSQLDNSEIMRKYFIGTINKVKQLNISLVQQKINSKSELADILGIKQEQFNTVCKRKSRLSQIRICYSISEIPGQQQIISCPKKGSQCKFPLTVSRSQ